MAIRARAADRTRPSPRSAAPRRTYFRARAIRSAVVYATLAIPLIFVPMLTIEDVAGRSFGGRMGDLERGQIGSQTRRHRTVNPNSISASSGRTGVKAVHQSFPAITGPADIDLASRFNTALSAKWVQTTALSHWRSIASTDALRSKALPFDIGQLRYAIAAADHGSFYCAARSMGVEQSTLSRKILKLEHAIGAKIFNRSRAGVNTTFVGDQFIRGARPIVASADKLVAMARVAGQGRAGGLRLGHNNSVSAGNLRATMMSWRDAHPDVQVECVEADRSVLLAGLDTGEIDVAILTGTAKHDGFRCEPLWSERMLVALPAAHPLAKRDVVHWTDLKGEQFLLPVADPGPEIRDMLLGRLAVSGVKPDIRMHQASRETILSILGGGAGMSIVCGGSTGARYPDVMYRPIHGEQGPALTGYSGYWRDDNSNPALRRLLGFIKARYALSFNISAKSVE